MSRHSSEAYFSVDRMIRVVRKFSSFAEADAASREYMQSLTPNQRLLIIEELLNRFQTGASQILSGYLTALNSHGVDYVVIGGYALAYHGHPRFTGDLDILIWPMLGNATRLVSAFKLNGFENFSPEQFLVPEVSVEVGAEPTRIDVFNSMKGVDVQTVWDGKVSGTLAEIDVQFVGLENFVAGKRALNRLSDRADMEEIGLK